MKNSKNQTSLFNMENATEGTQSAGTAKGGQKSAIKSRARISSYDHAHAAIVRGLKNYFLQNGLKRAVVGLSGGVDSSLTLKLAVDALGAENIFALILPELGVTKQENIDHAKLLCEFFSVKYFFQPINPFIMDFPSLPWNQNQLAKMNTKARTRAVLLYNFANTENAVVLGTSNKSEILLGYGTKFGDLAADIEVIGDLLKTEVWKLADFVGLPPEIVRKTPSAELAIGQTDEEEIGATYEDLDRVLAKLDLGMEGCVAAGLPLALVHLVFRRVAENKHKTELPPVIAIRPQTEKQS